MFDSTHRYAQQASRLTQQLFVSTSVLMVLLLIAAVALSWWWLLGIAAIVLFWGVYSAKMTTVPVRDLTAQQTLTVPMATWRAFKKAHPEAVAKNGQQ